MSDEITSREAGRILGVTRRHITRLIAAGALTPRRQLPGKTGWFLLDRAEVERYAESVSTRT